MKSQYSDEIINAYVDDELDGIEKEKFKTAMCQDPALKDKVHSICELKRALKNSYSEIPLPAASHNKISLTRFPAWQQAIAAIVMLVIGALFGWQGHDEYKNMQNISARDINVKGTLHGLKLTPVSLQQSNKIVLHIASSDPAKLKSALNQIEYILNQYKQNNLSFDLEVLANAGGITLLRNDLSPYRDKIRNIMTSNNNVSFIACSNGLQRLRDQGIEPRLIADTKTGVTAVEQIVKRLQEGWVYVKV